MLSRSHWRCFGVIVLGHDDDVRRRAPGEGCRASIARPRRPSRPRRAGGVAPASAPEARKRVAGGKPPLGIPPQAASRRRHILRAGGAKEGSRWEARPSRAHPPVTRHHAQSAPEGRQKRTQKLRPRNGPGPGTGAHASSPAGPAPSSAPIKRGRLSPQAKTPPSLCGFTTQAPARDAAAPAGGTPALHGAAASAPATAPAPAPSYSA